MRVPGVVWAVALIIIIAVVHENEAQIQAQMGIDPFIIDIVIAMLIAVMKSLSLGTEQLNQALDIVDKLLSSRRERLELPPGEGMRSTKAEAAEQPVFVEEIPERPNPAMRWLFG